MAITRTKKEEIIKKVTDVIAQAESVVFVNFHGLSVTDASLVRRALREKGVQYFVAKKSLVKRALESSGVAGEQPLLDGELALAYGDDLIAPAQEIDLFQKKMKERISLLGGVMEHRYINRDEVNALAKIPSREILYGQFVTVCIAPIQKTVSVLNAIPQSFVSVLNQIAEQKS